jgi:hypothetical protein
MKCNSIGSRKEAVWVPSFLLQAVALSDAITSILGNTQQVTTKNQVTHSGHHRQQNFKLMIFIFNILGEHFVFQLNNTNVPCGSCIQLG